MASAQSKPSTAGTLSLVAASVTAAVCLLYVSGPLAAVAGWLRAEEHTNLFSFSRYLLTNTLLILQDGLPVVAFGLAALAAAGFARRVIGPRLSVAAGIALVVAGVMAKTAPQVDIHVKVPTPILFLAIAWGALLALYERREAWLWFLPALALYRCTVLVGVPLDALLGVYLAGAAVLLFLLRAWLRSSSLRSFSLEAAGAAVLAAVALVVGGHLMHRSYIASLDMPYTIGFASLTTAILLVGLAASPALSRSRVALATLAVISLALAGVGWATALQPPRLAASGTSGRPNIVFIVWDTARADALEPYGAPAGATPTAAALANAGVVFEHAVTVAPWTLPSHATMFTGLPPRTHAACCGGYFKLDDGFMTLAEVLRDARYQTAAFVGNYFNVTRLTGLDQGFETFFCPGRSALWSAGPLSRMHERKMPYDKSGEAVAEAVRRWMLCKRDPARPFFIFVNLLEPHVPYGAPPEMVHLPRGVTLKQAEALGALEPRRWAVHGPTGAGIASAELGWETLRALYQAGVRYTDAITTRLLRNLGWSEPQRPPADTLLILTADHGEMLGEHDLSDHQFALFEPLLHVPLIMVWPQRLPAGQRVAQTVPLTDLFATVCDAAGAPVPSLAAATSRSLLPIAAAASGTPAPADRPIVAEYWPHVAILDGALKDCGLHSTPLGRFISPLQAVYLGRWKYIRALGQGPEALYDISQDPYEQFDLADRRPDVCRRARQILDDWIRSTPSGLPTFLDGRDVEAPAARAMTGGASHASPTR